MRDSIYSIVEQFLLKLLEKQGKTASSLSELKVFDSGLLDSLGLVEMTALVEKSIGKDLDMLLFDVTAIETMGDLVDQFLIASPAY